MSRSGCSRRSVATISRLNAPEPMTIGGVASASPAHDRVQRCRRGLGEHASLIRDAVSRDEHVLVNEEALAPPAARLFTRSHRAARAQGTASVGVLAEMGLTGAAAAALREPLMRAPQGGLDEDAIALRVPSGWTTRVRSTPTTSWPGITVPEALYAVSTLGNGSRWTRARSVPQMPASAGRMRTHPGPGGTGVRTSRTSTGSEELGWARRRRPRPRRPEPGSIRVGSTTSARIGRVEG